MPKRNRKVKSLGDVLKDVFQKERERGARLLEGQRKAGEQRKQLEERSKVQPPAPRVQVIDTSRPASEADKKMIANLDKPKKTATKKTATKKTAPKKTATKKTPFQKNRERGDRRKSRLGKR
jgi:hypothetical protein